jgi:small subunit ribosomal protein S11
MVEKEESKKIEEGKTEEQETQDNEDVQEVKEEKKEHVKEDKEEKKEIKEVKKKKEERIGILSIYTTFNNTIMNLTDMSGKSLAKFSGGQSTKQDRLKANPTIAMFIAQKIAEEAQDNGITGFYVKIRANTGQNNPGPGTHAAIKSLTRAGFKILSIMETTRIPRGGTKNKGGRRGRRV